MKSIIAVAAGTLVAGTQAQYQYATSNGHVYTLGPNSMNFGDYYKVQSVQFGDKASISSSGAQSVVNMGDGTKIYLGPQQQQKAPSVQGVTFGDKADIHTSGNGAVLNLGDGTTIQMQPQLSVRDVHFGDKASISTSGSGAILNFGDKATIGQQSQQKQPSVREVKFGDKAQISTSGQGATLNFGDDVTISTQPQLSVQGISFGDGTSIGTSGSGAILSFGDGVSIITPPKAKPAQKKTQTAKVGPKVMDFYINKINNDGSHNQWTFGDHNKIQGLNVQGVSFGNGANIHSSGDDSVTNFGDNTTIGIQPHLSVQGVSFGNKANIKTSGQDAILSFGDGVSIIAPPQAKPTQQMTQTEEDEPEVMDYYMDTINNRVPLGRPVYRDYNRVEDLNVQGASMYANNMGGRSSMISQVDYVPYQPMGMVYAYQGPMVEERRATRRPDVYVVVNERV